MVYSKSSRKHTWIRVALFCCCCLSCFGYQLSVNWLDYLDISVRSATSVKEFSWWRHQMETFSDLLAICAGNSPVPGDSPLKGQWRRALIFSLICVWINGWVNNREAGDLRRYRAHYDVIVMLKDMGNSALSHYPNQYRLIVHWTLRNKLQGNFNQNTKIPIHEYASEHIVCEMAAILSSGRWVNIIAAILPCTIWKTCHWNWQPRRIFMQRCPTLWNLHGNNFADQWVRKWDWPVMHINEAFT